MSKNLSYGCGTISEDKKKNRWVGRYEVGKDENGKRKRKKVYGKSITDPCLGWCDSENLILSLADQIE